MCFLLQMKPITSGVLIVATAVYVWCGVRLALPVDDDTNYIVTENGIPLHRLTADIDNDNEDDYEFLFSNPLSS